MVEGGMKCVKYLLFAFNLLFVIAAIVLIACGAYVQIKMSSYYAFLGSEFTAPGILLIIVGVIIFLIAFFGCLGAIKENYCLTMTFAVLLAIIFILEIAGGIAGFVLRNKLEDIVITQMIKSEDKYATDPAMKESWDNVQKTFKCCGVKNYTDWENKGVNGTYPASCCNGTESSAACANRAQNPRTALYDRGCEVGFIDFLKSNVVLIGGIGIGLALVQVIGIMCACCLARSIRKEYEVV